MPGPVWGAARTALRASVLLDFGRGWRTRNARPPTVNIPQKRATASPSTLGSSQDSINRGQLLVIYRSQVRYDIFEPWPKHPKPQEEGAHRSANARCGSRLRYV